LGPKEISQIADHDAGLVRRPSGSLPDHGGIFSFAAAFDEALRANEWDASRRQIAMPNMSRAQEGIDHAITVAAVRQSPKRANRGVAMPIARP